MSLKKFAIKRVLCVLLLIVWGQKVYAQSSAASQTPKNVILLIADGFGPASVTMARSYLQATSERESLVFDSLQVGSVATAAAGSRVTDSAAGATAMGTGHKTYNGVISLDTLMRPVASILEAAEQKGMATGLVATSRITHATPAAFSAHVEKRSSENKIASQQIMQGVDVILGGGARHFLPKTAGGVRTDNRNLFKEASRQGYHVVRSRKGFDRIDSGPVLGLFTLGHMSYEIDREAAREPSLKEMTTKALKLVKDNPEGFFLMVEGSRIDHAAHANDPAAHLQDILAFDKAVKEAFEFARKDGNTLVVITADHETGGLTLGRDGVYAWDPLQLQPVTASQGAMAEAVTQGTSPAKVLQEKAGIKDLKEKEQAMIRRTGDEAIGKTLSNIISRRARLAWTTGGHTGVDVNLYAYGPGREQFIGHYDNTYVGDLLADLLEVNLNALTNQLRESRARSEK